MNANKPRMNTIRFILSPIRVTKARPILGLNKPIAASNRTLVTFLIEKSKFDVWSRLEEGVGREAV